ncbi:hypothetical protein [Phormidesmis priestleyi]
MGLLPTQQLPSTSLAMPDFSDLQPEIGPLYSTIELVQRSPRIQGLSFNPVALIRSVNGLWQVGREQALTALQRYFELATGDYRQQYDLDEQRIFLILRLLFVQVDGSKMPPLLIGLPDVAPPDDDRFPLFPLAIVTQVPFLLVQGYMLGGLPQSPLEQLENCRQYGQLRSQPLIPESPIAAVESLLALAPYSQLAPEALTWYQGMLYQQALRSLRDTRKGSLAPLYSPSEAELATLTQPRSEDDQVAEWQQHVAAVAAIAPRWSVETQQFE